MSIEFGERPTLEHGFQLEVRNSGALLGHVHRNPRGIFQYYWGATEPIDVRVRGRRARPDQEASRSEGRYLSHCLNRIES